jgi:hypothetical protein
MFIYTYSREVDDDAIDDDSYMKVCICIYMDHIWSVYMRIYIIFEGMYIHKYICIYA